MTDLEKVEKLRERADVTYEEAKEALDASNGDLLDAMVYLEKHGKVKPPASSTFTTDYEKQTQYQNVVETVSEGKHQANEHSFGEKIKHLCRIIWNTLQNNTLHVVHKDKEIIEVPLGIALIIIIFTWSIIWAVILVSLFFDCRYHLTGKEDHAENASDAFNKASSAASAAANYAKDEFSKL